MNRKFGRLALSCLVVLGMASSACVSSLASEQAGEPTTLTAPSPAPTTTAQSSQMTSEGALPEPTLTAIPGVPTGSITLADGSLVAGGSGLFPVILHNNPAATDPTYAQLLAFLNQDNTDQSAYLPNVYVCADFATKLYNDAESQGIKAAFVALDGLDHALNAFHTTDKGLIYVDFTGREIGPQTIPPITVAGSTPIPTPETFGVSPNNKKIAYVQAGQPLGLISLDVAPNYGFQYSAYQDWLQRKQTFDSELSAYNTEVGADNAEGGVVVGSPEDTKLKAMSTAIDQLAQQLGGFWDPVGTPTGVEIFWQGNN